MNDNSWAGKIQKNVSASKFGDISKKAEQLEIFRETFS